MSPEFLGKGRSSPSSRHDLAHGPHIHTVQLCEDVNLLLGILGKSIGLPHFSVVHVTEGVGFLHLLYVKWLLPKPSVDGAFQDSQASGNFFDHNAFTI